MVQILKMHIRLMILFLKLIINHSQTVLIFGAIMVLPVNLQPLPAGNLSLLKLLIYHSITIYRRLIWRLKTLFAKGILVCRLKISTQIFRLLICVSAFSIAEWELSISLQTLLTILCLKWVSQCTHLIHARLKKSELSVLIHRLLSKLLTV